MNEMKIRRSFPLFSKVFVFLLMVLSAFPAHAYFRGGEITWECTSFGRFSFTMKLYRDCAGSGNFGDTLWMKSNVPGFDSIGLVRMAIYDITPVCDCHAGAALSCATASQTGSGALEEHIYSSDAFFPLGVPLTGVPPATGYYFAFEGCCRAPSTNLASGNNYFAIRSVMYPYGNNNIQSCFDNAPFLRERSPLVTCSGSELLYIPYAIDRDRDSIVWSWVPPLLDMNTPVNAYHAGYGYLSPLPSSIHDPLNAQVVLDSANGGIHFRSFTTGTFVLAVEATVYKAGVKVAEILREMVVIVLPCSSNNPPEITINGQPVSGLLVDTIEAGTMLSLNIVASDSDSCIGNIPVTLQKVYLSATGTQFDSPVNPWGCTNPPCAGLNPPIYQDSSISGVPTVQTLLTWQTDYQHLTEFTGCCPTCPLRTYYYDFYFKASDNFCPAPSTRTICYRVVVVPKSQMPAPPIKCADVLSNGDVALAWQAPVDSGMVFRSYYLSAAGQSGVGFTILDSMMNISQNTFIHQGANAQAQSVAYQLQVRNDSTAGKPIPGLPFDTLSTIFVQVTGYDSVMGVVNLIWNPLRINPLPGDVPEYTIHREFPVGNWNVAGTTTGLTWTDTLSPANKLVRYQVSTSGTVMTSGGPVVCQSNSNIAELLVNVGVHPQNTEQFSLGQNIPNPAGPGTIIPFHLPEAGEVTLQVMDINGRLLKQHVQHGHRGENVIDLDLKQFAAGIYSYTLYYQGVMQRKMMMVE